MDVIILTYGVISFLSLAKAEAFEGEPENVSVANGEEFVSFSLGKYLEWLP